VYSQLEEWEVARPVEACIGVDEPRVAGCGCESSEHWQQSKSGLRVGRKSSECVFFVCARWFRPVAGVLESANLTVRTRRQADCP